MLVLLLVPVSFHVTNMPVPMINYLRNNVNMGINVINENDVSWEKTFKCKNIINKYFHKMNIKDYNNLDNKFYGEMFKIYGYPGVLVVINNKSNSVEEFIINKNLMLMFDATKLMRWSFYKKFKKLNINHALNKDLFLII